MPQSGFGRDFIRFPRAAPPHQRASWDNHDQQRSQRALHERRNRRCQWAFRARDLSERAFGQPIVDCRRHFALCPARHIDADMAAAECDLGVVIGTDVLAEHT